MPITAFRLLPIARRRLSGAQVTSRACPSPGGAMPVRKPLRMETDPRKCGVCAIHMVRYCNLVKRAAP